jgi:hypothetical protein
MANTRELSQLASLISVNDETKSISVISNLPDAKLGIGTTNPGARIDVSGDVNVSGVVTATSFSGTATTTTNIPNLTGDITSVNTATTLATVNSNTGQFGSQTLIPVVTVNAKGLVTAVSTAAVGTALTVSGDSGSIDINLLTEALTISGGTNLTSSGSGNAVTVNLDDNISLTSVVASGNITGNVTGNINSSGISTLNNVVVGGATTALIVSGNARIIGILTIGTGSITLDGSNNQVNVGTGVTLHHTNGIQVGENNLHSTGLTLNSLNASGVITATSGFVGNVVGVATGLSSQNNNVFITSDSIKFIVNNNLVATISTTGLNMQSNKITSLSEPTAATDASTRNYADTGASNFPTGDYGGFTSGDTDPFGQVISDFASYDTLSLPSGSVQIEDFGVLT